MNFFNLHYMNSHTITFYVINGAIAYLKARISYDYLTREHFKLLFVYVLN